MGICSEYEISYKGITVGKAKIANEGIRYRISGSVQRGEFEEPFRLAIICGENKTVLGVMMPENDLCVYNRLFTSRELKDLRIHEIHGFTIIVSENKQDADKNSASDHWRKISDAGVLFAQGEFQRIFSACGEVLLRHEENMDYIAIPIKRGEEFPAMPVFCLGEPWKVENRLCLVFKVKDGKLLF